MASAAQLGLATGARVFHTLIVHMENELPLQCEDRYVNPLAAPEYLSVDFTRTTPTHYLLEVAATRAANEASLLPGACYFLRAEFAACAVDQPAERAYWFGAHPCRAVVSGGRLRTVQNT